MAARKTQEQRISAWTLAAVLSLIMLAPGLAGTALAATQRYVLDYNDIHVRSHRGEPATLFLKKTLREQYPGVDIDDLNLRQVALIAKSRHGQGAARLRVGPRETGMQTVYGRPNDFRDDRRFTFDRITFDNPGYGSQGPWQIELQGNLIVNKVVLEVEDRSRHHRRPPRWHRSEWYRF